MVSMKLTATSKEQTAGPVTVDESQPQYPYGLCLYLNEDAISALGLLVLPAVGSTMTITAKVTVTRAAVNESLLTGHATTPERSLDLQITDMELASEKKKATIEDALYGKA